MILNTALDCEH